MRQLVIIVSVLIILSIGGCPGQDASKLNQPIIKVGTQVITAQDVETKIKIEACYRDDKKTPEKWLGLYQLIEDALMESAAQTLNIVITPEILTQESERVDKETKAPAILAAVKAVCSDASNDLHGSIKLYRDIYLKPRLVNRVLHYQFSEDKSVQEVPYDKAKEALQFARAGKDLKSMEGYSVQEIDPEKPKQSPTCPDSPALRDVSGMNMAKYNLNMADPDKELIDSVLNTLKPGEVFPTIREDRYGFYIIKLLERRPVPSAGDGTPGGYYKYEMITCQKKDFDRWFNEAVVDIKKEIYQKDLIDQILKNTTSGTVNKFLKEK